MPEEIELSKLIPNARVVSYETADGLPAKGIHVGAGPHADARVLYFHGNAESAMQNLPLARSSRAAESRRSSRNTGATRDSRSGLRRLGFAGTGKRRSRHSSAPMSMLRRRSSWAGRSARASPSRSRPAGRRAS